MPERLHLNKLVLNDTEPTDETKRFAALVEAWCEQARRDTCPKHGNGLGEMHIMPSQERPCCKEEREQTNV